MPCLQFMCLCTVPRLDWTGAVDALAMPDRESRAGEALGCFALRRNGGRIPLRLARIADPSLITAVAAGLIRPPGRVRPKATVFMTATIP